MINSAIQGLRGLIGGVAPVARNMGQKVATAAQDPYVQAGGLVGGLVAADQAADYVDRGEIAANEQLNRWYNNVETHRPHDAHDAYNEDAFLRQAFKVAPNYDTYANILQQAGVTQSAWLTPKEYEAVAGDDGAAKRYVSEDARKSMAKSNEDQWGKDWEKKLYDEAEKDPNGSRKQWREWQAKQQAKYQAAMHRGLGGSEV